MQSAGGYDVTATIVQRLVWLISNQSIRVRFPMVVVEETTRRVVFERVEETTRRVVFERVELFTLWAKSEKEVADVL